jgi:hypothetical protein
MVEGLLDAAKGMVLKLEQVEKPTMHFYSAPL